MLKMLMGQGAALTAALLLGCATAAAAPTEQVISVNPQGTPSTSLAISKSGNVFGVSSGFHRWGSIFEVVRPHGTVTTWKTVYVKKFAYGTGDGAGPY